MELVMLVLGAALMMESYLLWSVFRGKDEVQ